MANYSAVEIGSVKLRVDPDSVGHNIRPKVQVVPALSGRTYLTVAENGTVAGAFQETLTLSGLYIGTSDVNTLRNLARNATLVDVKNIPGVLGEGKFIITNFQQSPIKPNVLFPGDTASDIKHSYSISLERVTHFQST